MKRTEDTEAASERGQACSPLLSAGGWTPRMLARNPQGDRTHPRQTGGGSVRNATVAEIPATFFSSSCKPQVPPTDAWASYGFVGLAKSFSIIVLRGCRSHQRSSPCPPFPHSLRAAQGPRQGTLLSEIRVTFRSRGALVLTEPKPLPTCEFSWGSDMLRGLSNFSEENRG